MITLLLAMLLPALVRPREPACRAGCQNNVLQFVVGLHVIGNDNEDRLPSGLSKMQLNNPSHKQRLLDEHTPVSFTAMRNILIDAISDEKVLMCPWLVKPFDNPGR